MPLTSTSVPAVSAIAAATPAAPATVPATAAPASTPAAAPAADASIEPVHRVRGRIRAQWEPTPAAPAATPATETSTPATPAAITPAATTPAAGATAETPAAPDDLGEALALLNKEVRATREARRKLEAKGAEHAKAGEQAATLAKAQTLFGEGKFAEAIKLIKSDANLDELSLSLIEASGADEKALTAADVERITAEKIEADRKAETERRQAEGQANLTKAARMYTEACQAELTAFAAQFPLLSQFDVNETDLHAFVRKHRDETGEVPAPAAVLQHFEKDIDRRLTAAGYSRAQISAIKQGEAQPATPIGSTVAGTTVMDTRGQLGTDTEQPRKTLSQLRREAREAAVRDASSGT